MDPRVWAGTGKEEGLGVEKYCALRVEESVFRSPTQEASIVEGPGRGSDLQRSKAGPVGLSP